MGGNFNDKNTFFNTSVKLWRAIFRTYNRLCAYFYRRKRNRSLHKNFLGGKMKARKIVLIFVLISILIINGCTINKNTQYSFDNQEIAAYIDGEPMYGLFGVNRNDYIEMKTVWMQYYISEYGDVTIPTANEMVGELFISLRDISQQIYYAEYANKYLEMSDSEKAIDYYIVLMKYSEGYVASG